MGIEYILDCECALRQEYGLDWMTEMFKHKTSVDTLCEVIALQEPDKNLEDVGYTYEKLEGDMRIRVKDNLAGMKEKTDAFTEKLKVCSDCPCNLVLPGGETRTGMGCYRTISYPIDAIAENILISAVKRVVTNPKEFPYANMVIEFIEENKISGNPIENMRKRGTYPFFELRDAPELKYGKIFRRSRINTNQIWELLSTQTIPYSYSVLIFEFLEVFRQEMKKEKDYKSSKTSFELLVFDMLLRTSVTNKADVLVHR